MFSKFFVYTIMLLPVTLWASNDLPVNCDVTVEKAKAVMNEKGFQDFIEKCVPKSTVENVSEATVDVINATGYNVQGIIETTASALSKAATELGITINEFITTPAGMLVVVVAVLSFIPNWVVTIPTIFIIVYMVSVRVNHLLFTTKYEYVPYLFGIFTRKRVLERTKNNNVENEVFFTFALGFLGILGIFAVML